MGFLRHPKTFAELRANEEWLARAKRSKRYLPTVYDDIFVAHGDRNWKRFRKTKWKTA